jgi:hypothetical protein
VFDQERFDELAKGLATNRLSRRQVLKNFAAGMLLAGPLGALWGREASAQQPGTCSVASRCPNKEYCSADQSCICVQSAEGDIRCGKIPSCAAKLCQSSADCADLGAGYFCDTPNTGCCTNPPAEQTRCIAPCTDAPCPPERVCGAECCPEGQVCINFVCSEETPEPCADDPVTSASMDAASSALAAGAKQVNLSPKGCMRYRRTLKGGRLTSEEVTLEGKPALLWKHTPTKSTGQRDTDLDGFFEWRSTVHRGAATVNDDRTVITEYSPTTKKPTRRETYTRTGDVWHVLIQEADQSGTLVTVAEFDTGPTIAATSRDQGAGGDLPNGEDRMAAQKAIQIEIAPNVKTIGCTKMERTALQAALKESRDVGTKCMAEYGAFDISLPMINHYVLRPIVITCKSLPEPKGKKQVCNAETARASVTGKSKTVRIAFDKLCFSKNISADELSQLMWHEMLHLETGDHLPGCNKACQNDPNPTRRSERDRTYACAQLCFGKQLGYEVTKCACDKCLKRPKVKRPKGQKCDPRCRLLGKCHFSAGEKRCTFPPPCPPPKTRQNGVCPPPPPGQKIYCNCNKKCYDDPQVCLSECKVTLGCFTGICGPAQPGQC